MLTVLSTTVLVGIYLLIIPLTFYLMSKYTKWLEIDHVGVRPFVFVFGSIFWPYTIICIGFINMLDILDALIIKIRAKK